MRTTIVFTALLLLGSTAFSQDSHTSQYAGQEQRKIKSLSPDDIKELRRGGGWGLAKAAELNGVPGPAHLLEMKDKVPLDQDQVALISQIWEAMKTEAIAEGEVLIGLERDLETAFRDGSITEVLLAEKVNAIAASRARLRIIHLSTHLRTPDILSGEQIDKYNVLRGYAGDPCENIPDGHNAAMWKKHNGCE